MHLTFKDKKDQVHSLSFKEAALKEGANLDWDREVDYADMSYIDYKETIGPLTEEHFKKLEKHPRICSVQGNQYEQYNIIDMPLSELFQKVAEAKKAGAVVLDVTKQSGSKAYYKWAWPDEGKEKTEAEIKALQKKNRGPKGFFGHSYIRSQKLI